MGTVVLHNIEKWYGQTLACTNINLHIEDGQFFTFLGPSGCGKTTLLRLIAGFIRPDSGSIILNDVNITSLEPEKRNVGMVFQNYALFPFMTVIENIEYGLKVQKRSTSQIKEKAERYLSMVGLEGLGGRPVSQLSGGEQQRVALARSLAIEPKVLLLDEPLSNLDARLRDNMRSELKRLQTQLGITTIFVTHDQTEALTMSDQLAVFNEGKSIQTGTPEEIYQKPKDSFVAQFIGETNLLSLHSCDNENDSLLINSILAGIHNDTGRFISIRPQAIRISAESADCDHSFAGVVENKRYNGLTTELSVRVDNLLFRSIRLNSESEHYTPSVGQNVFVNFSANDLHILER
ncbi:ABC transporter ATP-binding protein [Desulfopila sp. IMCC35008]|uniref:ABC transporter ATP-binding protein n=1 Tax=Desulfopila sp. IMCC35008 TaxID=2653858 RepID=UPI0013D56AE3|nr:ABC transporter ATP-binding protein [Desulfopila sp. IMCC35008]